MVKEARFNPAEIEVLCLPSSNGDPLWAVKEAHGLRIDTRDGRLLDGQQPALNGQINYVKMLLKQAQSQPQAKLTQPELPTLRQVAEWLHNLGANVTLIAKGSKRPMHKWRHWQRGRQTKEELVNLPWHGYTQADGTIVEPSAIGIVNGSGYLRMFDLDGCKIKREPVPQQDAELVLTAMELPLDYPWVYRSGSGLGWGIIVYCTETLPDGVLTASNKEPGVFWGEPKQTGSALDHLELRWSSGQTVIYGEHPEGPGYQWLHGLPVEPPATVAATAVLKGFFAIARPKKPEERIQQKDKSVNDRVGNEPQDNSIKEQIRERFDIVAWAAANISRDVRQEANGEYRILGNGGLLIKPDEGIWNCFGDGEQGQRWGGDCFDLIGWQHYEDDWFSNKGKYWSAVLQTAAEYTGIPMSAQETATTTSTTEQSADGTIASLRPMALAELLAKDFAPLVFLVERLIAKGQLVMLGGRPKSGKSWLVLQLAKCIDTGETFLGRATRQARVLHIALEDGERRIYERAKILKWQPQQTAVLFGMAKFDGSGGTAGPGLTQIREAAANYELIIIDTLIASLSGAANENDNVQMGAIINELARIAHENEVAIVIVHHTGKTVSDDVFNTLRGASALRGGYDVGLLLERMQGEKEAILHAESRDIDVEPMTLRQLQNGAGWEYVGNAFEINKIRAGRATLQAMLDMDNQDTGLTVKAIAEHRNVSETAVYSQLKRLVEDGYVEVQEKPSTEDGKQPNLYFVREAYR